MDDAIEFSLIEDCLADRRKRSSRFPALLEVEYQRSVSRHRTLGMRNSIVPFVLTYNIFLCVDYLLVPQTFWLSVLLHLCVVTPLIFACALIKPETSLAVRETLAASIAVGMVAQILIIYAVTSGPARDHYQYLAIFILVNMNVNQRLDYRFARTVSGLICLAYGATLLSGSSPLAVKVIGITSIAVAAYVTLSANRRMERDVRYVFLRRMQDKLLRKRAEAEATSDALTNLSNRRQLERQTLALWSAPESRDLPIAVLMIDIDHFKALNDFYGHVAGDLCLKRIAGALTAELRSTHDLAVRFGGEEFVVLLPMADSKEATRVAERMRRMIYRLAIPHERGGRLGVVTASIGVATGTVSAITADELIAAADVALYEAKRNGRNMVWPPFLASKPAIPSEQVAAAV